MSEASLTAGARRPGNQDRPKIRRPKHQPLDSNKTFRAPSRRVHIWQSLAKQFPSARPWRTDDMLRLYFRDRTFMFVDETGRVRSTGGLSTKAFITFPIHDLEKDWKKYRTRSALSTEEANRTEPHVEHRIPNAKRCQTTEPDKGSCENAA